MTDWRSIVVADTLSLLEAIQILDRTALQILLVVDGEDRLIGTLTDGDIRRAILKAAQMTAPISDAMNRRPFVGKFGEPRHRHLDQMAQVQVHQLPLVDENNCVRGLVTLDDLALQHAEQKNWVVLMAGGLGRRLRPYTNSVPKPMLEVGGKPILETAIENFVRQNFRRFYISVNFQANVLKDYFGDGHKWGIEIRYLEESDRLGTAGALSLIEETPTNPILVMNGDIISAVNFRGLLDYHVECAAQATMCVREYDLQVPFGVVQVRDGQIATIDEKPVQKFLVNAGIYAINPDALSLIEQKRELDMTTFFERIIDRKMRTAVYPVHEYWIDIGRPEDFMRANREIGQVRPW